MYNLGDGFPDVEPGANILVTGPPMTGKFSFSLDILAHGIRRGEGAIVVTTKDGGEKTLASVLERVDDVDGTPIGIVDCVSKQQGMGSATSSDQITYASSPVDMTGIGIKLSEYLQRFYQGEGVHQNRILLHSLSTLLMYSNLQTVFRFLHVFTGRIQSADALGVFIIDSTAHDQQTMSTLKQLFDGQLEIREGDDGRELRTTGLSDGSSEWRALQ